MAKYQLEVLNALDLAKTQLYHFTAIVIAGMGSSQMPMTCSVFPPSRNFLDGFEVIVFELQEDRWFTG